VGYDSPQAAPRRRDRRRSEQTAQREDRKDVRSVWPSANYAVSRI